MSKRHIAPLLNGRIRLRLIEEADLPMTLAWRNQDHIRKWFFDSRVLSPDQHRAWYAQYQNRDDDFVFVIEEIATLNRPVGQVALYHIDWTAGRAEFGRLMIGDPAGVGVGLARLATARLLAESWTTWGLTEVYLSVRETNEAALRSYRACGFTAVSQADGNVHMRVMDSGRQR